MATINLATKYASKIADKFYVDSVILGKTSKEYNWDGSETIKVWTIQTYAPTDYGKPANDTAITGAHARYGSTYEVADTVQTMTLTQDKAVSLSVDKGNNTEQMLIKNSGVVLARELREQFVPMFDKYALARWSGLMTTAPSWASLVQSSVDGTPTKANIVEKISDGITAIRNQGTDVNDAYCYIGESNFGKLLLSPEFLNVDKLGERNLEKGAMGKVRGLQVIPVPDSYLNSTGNTNLTKDVNFMIVKKDVVLAPTKIKDAKVHSDPVGISGALLEVRWLFDAFALEAKAGGIYVSKVA
jgi:hypothetical protein